jgi:hypothetical protein
VVDQEQQLLTVVSDLLGQNKISALIAGWMFFVVHLWGQVELILGMRKGRLSDDTKKLKQAKPDEEVY